MTLRCGYYTGVAILYHWCKIEQLTAIKTGLSKLQIRQYLSNTVPFANQKGVCFINLLSKILFNRQI